MSAKTALLVIDVQLGMYDPQYPVSHGDELLEKIQGLIGRARQAGAPVIFVQHAGGEGDPLHPQEPGWALHPGLGVQPGEPIIHKRYPDSFQETSLQAELQALDVHRLVICGIQTEYCVDTTCRRAFSMGYQSILAQDAHGTWDGEAISAEQIIAHHNQVLGSWFATLMPAEAIAFEPQ